MESTSNGFVIDPQPPTLDILSVGQNAIERAQSYAANHTTYQTTASFSALWEASDSQSGLENGAIYTIDTYPGRRDIQAGTASLDNHIYGSIDGESGIPHYLTVEVTDRAGVSTVRTSNSIVLDTSPPTVGEVGCYSIISTRDSLNHCDYWFMCILV